MKSIKKQIIRETRPRKCFGASFLPLIECDNLMLAHSIHFRELTNNFT